MGSTDDSGDGNQDDGSNTPLEDMAATFFETVGGDRDEFEDELDRQFGDDRGSAVDDAASAGLAFGTAFSELERLSEQRESLRAQADGGDADDDVDVQDAAVRVREIERRDGTISGMRIMCSDPEAQVFVSDSTILIRGPTIDEEQPAPFDVAGVSEVDRDGITEYVVRADLTSELEVEGAIEGETPTTDTEIVPVEDDGTEGSDEQDGAVDEDVTDDDVQDDGDEPDDESIEELADENPPEGSNLGDRVAKLFGSDDGDGE